jgi:hypothetical protein
MYLNDYSVVIPEGSERPGGYVEMEHGKKYTLRLRNSNSTPCDAQVEIDGKHVGTWRLRPHWGFTLERPAHDDGCFTFYEVGTEAARKAGVDAYSADTGLVRVTFLPGKEEEVSWTLTYSAGSQNWRGTTISDGTSARVGASCPSHPARATLRVEQVAQACLERATRGL